MVAPEGLAGQPLVQTQPIRRLQHGHRTQLIGTATAAAAAAVGARLACIAAQERVAGVPDVVTCRVAANTQIQQCELAILNLRYPNIPA